MDQMDDVVGDVVIDLSFEEASTLVVDHGNDYVTIGIVAVDSVVSEENEVIDLPYVQLSPRYFSKEKVSHSDYFANLVIEAS